MMLIQRKEFTAGDKRKLTVSYDAFLPLGGSVITATVTTPDLSVTISGIDVATNNRKVSFFVAGGTANTTLTVTVQITDDLGQIVTDTIEFAVIAP